MVALAVVLLLQSVDLAPSLDQRTLVDPVLLHQIELEEMESLDLRQHLGLNSPFLHEHR